MKVTYQNIHERDLLQILLIISDKVTEPMSCNRFNMGSHTRGDNINILGACAMMVHYQATPSSEGHLIEKARSSLHPPSPGATLLVQRISCLSLDR